MPKYVVTGEMRVGIAIEVEAENREEAIETAEDTFGGLNQYAGHSKLISVSGSNESIHPTDDVTWNNVKEL